jgi:hypothetical protein
MTGDGVFAAAALDEQLRNVGGFSSLSLALLVLFTNRRADSLEGWQEGDRRTVRGRARWDIVFDAVLLVFSILLLAALFPLLYDVMDDLSIGRNAGAMRSLFVLVWVGFVVLAAFQYWILRDRLTRYATTHPK